MLSLTLLNSIAFGLYGECKALVRSLNKNNDPTINSLQYYIAGCGVGFSSSVLSTPFEVVKVRMQHASGKQYKSSVEAATQLVRSYGPSVLYTGHMVNTWREMFFCTVYFGGYENLKEFLSTQLQQQGSPNPQLAILLAGGCAGMLGWLTSYPLDVIKNLKQTQTLEGTWLFRGQNSFHLAAQRFRQLGISGFYQGIKPSLIRAFFVSGTRFSAYEFALRMWKWMDKSEPGTGEIIVPVSSSSSVRTEK